MTDAQPTPGSQRGEAFATMIGIELSAGSQTPLR
jgi:hypothetical protein